MTYKPFKMKGSPMQRNYNVGAEDSPAKQTKSGKGNIFTKKGKAQRRINKTVKARADYLDPRTGGTDKQKKKVDKAFKKLDKSQYNSEHNLRQYVFDKESGKQNAHQEQQQRMKK